jgi:DNA (cytosine-5)-methyltransferase 1
MENVPQVHGANNIADFAEWISFLDSLGYTSKWQDLNAKDFGVAQNRERTFMVSWLGTRKFYFPQPRPLYKTMRDYLEDNVAEKYYLKSGKVQKLIDDLVESGQLERERESVDLTDGNPKRLDVACAITTAQRGISRHQQESAGVCEREL